MVNWLELSLIMSLQLPAPRGVTLNVLALGVVATLALPTHRLLLTVNDLA